MGGGLMQLVAYGAQDVFLTGNPQITFFKIVYRRHTNFAIESIEQTFTGTADFSRKVTCTIARSGDLITKMYLRVTLPQFDCGANGQWAWVSRIGHALIDSVELEIGGTRIDKQYGDWLNIWNELARNWAQDRGYNLLIGNTADLTTLNRVHNKTVLYVPLKFFSNRHDGLAIPLIALQYHETKINIEFKPRYECIVTSGNPVMDGLAISDSSLFVDYIYLDAEERKRFAQAQHEYLIEQLQFGGSEAINSVNQKFRLNFNHPCKAIYWALRLGKYTHGYNFLVQSTGNTLSDRANASRRFVLACAAYQNTQNDASGTIIPGTFNLVLVNGAVQPAVGLPANLLAKFQAINPVAVSTTAIASNISILGTPLSIGDVSTTTASLLEAVVGWARPTAQTTQFAVGGAVAQAVDNQGTVNYDVKVTQWDNYGIYFDRTVNPIINVALTLNGHDRFSQRDGAYFNYVQPYQCHSNTPSDGINMYSFALNPEDHQPSGTCNFSRIDNATLSLNFGNPNDPTNPTYNANFFSDAEIDIFATNYNVLRIMSGMGGLAYSN
jgi:hypothetical protein